MITIVITKTKIGIYQYLPSSASCLDGNSMGDVSIPVWYLGERPMARETGGLETGNITHLGALKLYLSTQWFGKLRTIFIMNSLSL